MDLTSTLAARGYDAARGIARPEPQDGMTAQGGFARAAQDFALTLRQGEATAQAAMTGGADPLRARAGAGPDRARRRGGRERARPRGRGLPGDPEDARLMRRAGGAA